MSRKVFINLPVKDLGRSMDFFKQLGFEFNPQFTDEKGAAMVLSDEGFVMLVVEPFFQTFTKKEIADATSETEVIVALSAGSKE
jgi:predicted lactoylglutathione lyase